MYTSTNSPEDISSDERDALIASAAEDIFSEMTTADMMCMACNAIHDEIEALPTDIRVQILETPPKYRLKALLTTSKSFHNLVYKRH